MDSAEEFNLYNAIIIIKDQFLAKVFYFTIAIIVPHVIFCQFDSLVWVLFDWMSVGGGNLN